MAIINPNLADVKDLQAIPEGVYAAVITEVSLKTSKTGNPMIVPKFTIQTPDGERVREAYLVITGAGAFNFESFLRACNFDELADQYRDPEVQPKPPFDTDWIHGMSIQLNIKADTYNGRITDKIDGFLKA